MYYILTKVAKLSESFLLKTNHVHKNYCYGLLKVCLFWRRWEFISLLYFWVQSIMVSTWINSFFYFTFGDFACLEKVTYRFRKHAYIVDAFNHKVRLRPALYLIDNQFEFSCILASGLTTSFRISKKRDVASPEVNSQLNINWMHAHWVFD